MGKHRNLFGMIAAHTDLAKPDNPTPKHRAGHVHDWEVVGEFTGLRMAIEQCRGCADTRTTWRTEVGA